MKRNTRKLKQILVTGILVLGILTISVSTSKAALQANQKTHNLSEPKALTGAAWIQQIREMETSGQTMGLNETINTDLTPASSNNIDVHMMRSTEYGAMAILSASGFGYSGRIRNAPIRSTTGNVTGVYIAKRDEPEWTAGGDSTNIVGKDARYYDLYTVNDQTSAKIGDALGFDTYNNNPGCFGWHNSNNGEWIKANNCGFLRGDDGYIFSFLGSYPWSAGHYLGRGVAVVGNGL